MLVLSCILIYFKKVRTINRDIKHVSSFYILFWIIFAVDIDMYIHTHMHCAYTHGQTDTEQLTLSFLSPHLQKTHVVMSIVSAGYNPHLQSLWEAQVIMNTGILTFVFPSVYIIRVI